jgi:hypothetical protein
MQKRKLISIHSKVVMKFSLLVIFALFNSSIMFAQDAKNKLKTITMVYPLTGVIAEVYTLDLNGNLHGTYKTYYSTGLPNTFKTYSHGVLNGPLKSWYENGALEYDDLYQDGICIHSKTYESKYINGHNKMTLTLDEIHDNNDNVLSYSSWNDDKQMLEQTIGTLQNGGNWKYINSNEDGMEYQEEYPKNDTIYIWWNKNKINFKGKQINGTYSIKYAIDGSVLNQTTTNGHKIERKSIDNGYIVEEIWSKHDEISQQDTMYTIETEETKKYTKISKFYKMKFNDDYNINTEFLELFYKDKETKDIYKRILDKSTELSGYNVWYYSHNNDLQCKIFIAINNKYKTLKDFFDKNNGHTPFDNEINSFMSNYNLPEIENPHNQNIPIYEIIKSNGDYFATDMFDSLLDDKFKNMFKTSLTNENQVVNLKETIKSNRIDAICKQGNKTTFNSINHGVTNDVVFIDGKTDNEMYQKLYDIGNGLALHPKAIIRNTLKIDMSIADFNTNKIKPQIIGQRLSDLLNYLNKNVKKDQDVYLMLREIQNGQTPLTSFKIINIEKNGNIIIIKTESNRADITFTFDSIFTFENGISKDEQTNKLFTLIAHKLESVEKK